MGIAIAILASVTGTAGIFGFIEFLIRRHDEKKKNATAAFQNTVMSKLEFLELETCRIHLLVLMNHYPNDIKEIMKVAQHYFQDLHGDWDISSLFNKYLKDNKIEKPVWFIEE